MLAERMAMQGHRVEVLTSCAVEYTTWADDYEPGVSELGGVTVHRLPVRRERSIEQFGPISQRVLGDGHAALAVERDWVRVQGPDMPDLEPWLDANAARFDAANFFTYLYPQSALGVRVAARRTATILHPAAHDEPTMDLRVFDEAYRSADAISTFTPEEAETLTRRFRHGPPTDVVGLGVELDPAAADAARFRERYGLGDAAVFLYVGRIEPGKGTDELARYFTQFIRRTGHNARLVMVGPVIEPVLDHPAIVCTGFIDEQARLDAFAVASVFVMPSYFESFSIALCDAWVVRRPALVNGNCAVLAGQIRRSGGGFCYRDYAEFEAVADLMLQRADEMTWIGQRGRRYVEANYGWDVVLERHEHLISTAISARAARHTGSRPGADRD
jgi:glycosyltransferase involved in cell wall biosynthesis